MKGAETVNFALSAIYSVHKPINCYNRWLLSCKESGTLRISHFMSPTASSLSHLMITLWWGGNRQQCYHSHAGTDCTTSTFTASDSPNDPNVGFKMLENWKRGAHKRVICVCKKGRGVFCDLDQTVWVCLCVCVLWVIGSYIGYRHIFFWCLQNIGWVLVPTGSHASRWLNISNDFCHEFCTLFWLPVLWTVKHL